MSQRQSLFTVLTFITLLATMLTHQFGSRRYQRISEARIKSDELREALHDLRLCLVDAETGYRGYLLADNDWYKETYTKALNRLPQVMDRLDELYDRKSLAYLFKLTKMRMELMQQCISLYDRGLKTEAIEFLKAGEGKKVMDLFRQEISRMKRESLEQERSLHEDFQIASAWLLNGLGMMHLVVLVLIALAMIPESSLKELINRKKNE